jgi:hypothetical protein
MINQISSYRGLSTNQHDTKTQSLPVGIWNPLRNLLFTKEDMQEDTPADIAVEIQNGLGESLSQGAQNEYLQVAGETGASGEAARENAKKKEEEARKKVVENLPAPGTVKKKVSTGFSEIAMCEDDDYTGQGCPPAPN